MEEKNVIFEVTKIGFAVNNQWNVFVDNEYIGKIDFQQNLTKKLSKGTHTAQYKIGLQKTKVLTFIVGDEDIIIECIWDGTVRNFHIVGEKINNNHNHNANVSNLQYCSNCGNEIKQGSAFCAKCGNKLEVISNSSNITTDNVQAEAQIAQSKYTFLSILVRCIIFLGIMYWVFVGIPNKVHNDSIPGIIQNALSQELNIVLTEDNFTFSEIIKSDYRPGYKVNIDGIGVVYVGLIFPNGKNGVSRSFIISEDLDTLKKALNATILSD